MGFLSLITIQLGVQEMEFRMYQRSDQSACPTIFTNRLKRPLGLYRCSIFLFNDRYYCWLWWYCSINCKWQATVYILCDTWNLRLWSNDWRNWNANLRTTSKRKGKSCKISTQGSTHGPLTTRYYSWPWSSVWIFLVPCAVLSGASTLSN